MKNIEDRYYTILADPPWRFDRRNIECSPEGSKTFRYPTLSLDEIKNFPISEYNEKSGHLYLWIPNAMLEDGLSVMKAWGYTYKTNIIWCKTRKDGQPSGAGLGSYFRNATEICLFGTKGKDIKTKQNTCTQINIINAKRREHSRKPDEMYNIIETCSKGPYLELFARTNRKGWAQFGNETDKFGEI